MAAGRDDFLRRLVRHWLGLVALMLVLSAGGVPSSFGPPNRPSTSAAPPPRPSPSASWGSAVKPLVSPSAAVSSPPPPPPSTSRPPLPRPAPRRAPSTSPFSCPCTLMQVGTANQSAITA